MMESRFVYTCMDRETEAQGGVWLCLTVLGSQVETGEPHAYFQNILCSLCRFSPFDSLLGFRLWLNLIAQSGLWSFKVSAI